MAERRSLIEGLTPQADPELEEQFVYGAKTPRSRRTAPVADIEPQAPLPSLPQVNPTIVEGRVLISARVRASLANRLKRISLERQLAGKEPNRLQDIAEEALEAWFAAQEEPA